MSDSPLTVLILKVMRYATLGVAGVTGVVGLVLAWQLAVRGTAPTGGEGLALGLFGAVVVASLLLARAIGRQSGSQS